MNYLNITPHTHIAWSSKGFEVPPLELNILFLELNILFLEYIELCLGICDALF